MKRLLLNATHLKSWYLQVALIASSWCMTEYGRICMTKHEKFVTNFRTPKWKQNMNIKRGVQKRFQIEIIGFDKVVLELNLFLILFEVKWN